MNASSRVVAVAVFGFGLPMAHATGIPVVDVANLIQAIQQVADDITQIENQVQQIDQLRSQLESMTGSRNLGNANDNPDLHNYIPPRADAYLDAVSRDGYASLTATAKALRDSRMVYNCMDLEGDARMRCQGALALPYQSKGLLQDAMNAAAGRLAQIQALMGRINATTDAKSIQEVQARIGAENAMLAHEATQIQLLQAISDSDERIARSRDHERQLQMQKRTARIVDYLH